jgi:small neutral amino acid transporter SnatA (MarC family)
MHDTIAELIRGSLLIIGALFPIVNGPDNIPLFLMLTAGLSTESRAVLALKIAVYGFVLRWFPFWSERTSSHFSVSRCPSSKSAVA